MRPEQRRRILEDAGRSGARRLARDLGLTRPEVEAVLAESRSAASTASAERACPVHEGWIAAGVFLLALAVRLYFVNVLKDTPFFGPLSDKLDDGVYDTMARSISQGNWAADFPDGAYRVPGYPYFLGVLYRVFGRSLMAVHLVQALVGSLASAATVLLTRRLFGCWKSALAAGLLAAGYVPLIFFENMLLGESLSVLLNVLAWWALAAGWDGKGGRSWPFAAGGGLLGLSCLLRPNTILPVAAVILFTAGWFACKGQRREALVRAGLLAGFAAAAIAPITVRNAVLYRDFVPVTAVGGVNLYVGNNPEADGRFHMTPEIGSALGEMIRNSRETAERDAGRPLKASEVSNYWTARALRFWAQEPAAAARLFALKAGLLLNRYEYPDILGIDFAAQLVPPLGARFVDHGLLVVLAAAGLWAFSRRGSRGGFALSYAVFTAAYAASIVLFFLTARYRLPVSVLLIPPAGYGLIRLGSGLGRLDAAGLRGPAATAMLAFVAAYWPIERTTQAGNYNSLGVYYRNAGEYAKAEACYRKAIELEPAYASPHRNLAVLYDKTGRPAESAAEEKKYRELSGKN